MAKILVTTDRAGRRAHFGLDTGDPVVEVIEISDVDGVYGLGCSEDRGDGCLSDIEPGDTWSDLGEAVRQALVHIHNHETRQ